jgi:hypothetical protein
MRIRNQEKMIVLLMMVIMIKGTPSMRDEFFVIFTIIGILIAFRLGFQLSFYTSDNFLLFQITQH